MCQKGFHKQTNPCEDTQLQSSEHPTAVPPIAWAHNMPVKQMHIEQNLSTKLVAVNRIVSNMVKVPQGS